LALLGLAEGVTLTPPVRPFECLRLAEVIDRHDAGDSFVKTWTSFTPLAEGELIATRADGTELRAPRAGRVEKIYVAPGKGVETGSRLVRLA
jgi:multidrug efflux pump subunit AcrA (membrane-fusion protein)